MMMMMIRISFKFSPCQSRSQLSSPDTEVNKSRQFLGGAERRSQSYILLVIYFAEILSISSYNF